MILVIEDSKTQRVKLLQSLEEAGYSDVKELESAEALFRCLKNETSCSSINLILIDNNLPGMSGTDAAKRLKHSPKYRDIPIIMITANADLHALERAFDVGINDYLTKPFTRIELFARIQSALRLKQETDARKFREQQLKQSTKQLKQMNAQLSQKEQQLLKLTKELKKMSQVFKLQSQQDGLTGLANRRYFDQTIRKLWDKAFQLETPLSMIVLDVDAFKRYNDTYGHSKGDECLVAVAKTLTSNFPTTLGFVARYGGEEFVISLPDVNLKRATSLAEKIRKDIMALSVPHATSLTHDVVTASFGVATLIPEANEPYERLLQLADRALYRAKQNGRNRVEVLSVRDTSLSEDLKLSEIP